MEEAAQPRPEPMPATGAEGGPAPFVDRRAAPTGRRLRPPTPRVALMLTLIMSVLIGLIVLSNQFGAAPTRYISLFPLVILTGMVERFWTVETEDSVAPEIFRMSWPTFNALALLLPTNCATQLSSRTSPPYDSRYCRMSTRLIRPPGSMATE